MKINRLLTELREAASGRFELTETDSLVERLKAFADKELIDIGVVRLRRHEKTSAHWRTLLTVSIASKSQLDIALRWAAEVRDSLIEPETSDLYLFLLVPDLLPHECSRLEANEQFCRKYVINEIHDVQQMLERTFLGNSFESTLSTKLFDPVTAAFHETQDVHRWFSRGHQEIWLQALLSNSATGDIVTQLLADPVVERSA